MDALRQSVLRAQMAKPLPESAAGRSQRSSAARASEMAALDARFCALDKKLDTLLHMIKAPPKRPGTSDRLFIADVRRVVAAFFNVTDEDLDQHQRSRRTARIRQIAFYLCRTHTTNSLAEIGRAFHRDHATILHGVRRIGASREADTALDDVLLRLEAQLADMLARRSAA